MSAWPRALAALAITLSCAAHAEYEDKLIDPSELPALSDEDSGKPYNPEGLARSWRVEGYGSRIESNGRVRTENGLLLSTRLDSLEYGALTLDATLRPHANVVTFWQRGLAFDAGWRANNAAGMISTPSIDLSRQQYRFFLPTFPTVGVQTEWIHKNDFVIQASVGEPGFYSGLRLAEFKRLGGTIATLGMQWLMPVDYAAGLYVADAHGVKDSPDSTEPPASGRSIYAVLARQEGGDRWQVNLLDSKLEKGDRHQYAMWFDGETASTRLRHNYGVFRFDPDVSWAYVPVSRDLVGGYYRVNYVSQRLTWSAGIDSIGSVTGRGTEGSYATGSIRLQLDTRTGIGGGVNARHSATDAASVYAFLDRQSLFGTTRAQLDFVGGQGGQRGEQLTIDQTWPTRVGLRLTTSLALAREQIGGLTTRRASLGAFGGIDLTNTITLEGTVRVGRDRDTARTSATYADLSLMWRFAPRWSLVASYYDNRSDIRPFASIGPIIPLPLEPMQAHDRAIFVTVRYEDHAGTAVSPLGGLPGSGAGRIAGFIFYDANDDGRRSANEKGASNVTVILDGRFGVRTDSSGGFDFPLVASGPHYLVVMPDNLALPYSISNEGKREVQVRTRETSMLEIAATRAP